MKIVKFLTVLMLITSLIGCDDDDEPKVSSINFIINHYWNGEKITFEDLNSKIFINANNDTLTISKLKYLISNITLHTPNGTTINGTHFNSFELLEYYLVDHFDNEFSSLFPLTTLLTVDNFTSISFTFGFNEADNIDGNYLDLNSASWNWPAMLGSGYHFMQFEGKYGATGTENPFAYHMGTARVSTGVFEQNFFNVSLGGFSTTENTIIEIKMNLDQWFENPNTWDLEVYNTTLMPNYDAQIMMNQNGRSVFSLGEVNY